MIIKTRWYVAGVLAVAVLTAACEMAAGDQLSFPRLLWYLPVTVLTAIGLSLATEIFRRITQSRRK